MRKSTVRTGVGQVVMGFAKKRKKPGPKPRKDVIPHASRPEMKSSDVALVTIKLIQGLPSLRRQAASQVILDGIERVNGKGLVRIVHYSIQSNHVHMLIEAENSADLSSGMASLNTGLGMRLNRLWNRVGQGSVFVERFYLRLITNPTQMRNVLLYVLKNDEHHGVKRDVNRNPYDPYSSAATFPWWDEFAPTLTGNEPTVLPQTWLLSVGWQKARDQTPYISLLKTPSLQAPRSLQA